MEDSAKESRKFGDKRRDLLGEALFCPSAICVKSLEMFGTYSVALERKKRFDMRSQMVSPEKDAANSLRATLAVAIL